MYIPKQFMVTDREKIIPFIKQNSFGILVSSVDQSVTGTHLPFVLDEERNQLISHMAKMNDQWREVEGQEVLVIFPGPHAYISASWYQDENSVPTWNYVSVHLYGTCKIIQEREAALTAMRQIVDFYESGRATPWSMIEQNEYQRSLLEHITVFAIDIERVEGKWKLNQHHSQEKQRRVMEELRKEDDHYAQEIARLMEENR